MKSFSDAYIICSECPNRNKTWKRFLNERQSFIDALQSTIEAKLISEDEGRVMIHPILASRLRAWCSVEYEVSLYAQMCYDKSITDTEESDIDSLVSHPVDMIV